MFACLAQRKMGMRLMLDLMESVSRRIRTQSSLFGRLLEVAWSSLFLFTYSANAEGNQNANEMN
jgi:hypothetical protein